MPFINVRLALTFALSLLFVLSAPALAVSDGRPAPAPAWAVPNIAEPLLVPQEGVIAIQATYMVYGGGDYVEEEPRYAVRVFNDVGEELEGEVSYLTLDSETPHMLVWRADAPLSPGASLSIELNLEQHSASTRDDYLNTFDLVVSDEETPPLVGAEVLSHTPRISGATLRDYACYAPNVYVAWDAAEDYPEWLHRTLTYELGHVTTGGALISSESYNDFKVTKTYKSFASYPEELSDTYCISITTRSLMDDSSVTEESCLSEQAFLDALEEDQVLCTPDTYQDYPKPSASAQESSEPSEDTGADTGGCQGQSGPSPLALALALGFGVWFWRRAKAPIL